MTLETVFQTPTHTAQIATGNGIPVINTKLTRIKFKQRMTAAERIAVRAAADINPIIFDFLDLVSDATYIDLSLPETIAGVSYLESEGHLAVGRADEILLTPVTPNEAYN